MNELKICSSTQCDSGFKKAQEGAPYESTTIRNHRSKINASPYGPVFFLFFPCDCLPHLILQTKPRQAGLNGLKNRLIWACRQLGCNYLTTTECRYHKVGVGNSHCDLFLARCHCGVRSFNNIAYVPSISVSEQ